MANIDRRKATIKLYSKEDTTNPTTFKISQGQLKTQISTGGLFELSENNSTVTNIVSRLNATDTIQNSITSVNSINTNFLPSLPSISSFVTSFQSKIDDNKYSLNISTSTIKSKISYGTSFAVSRSQIYSIQISIQSNKCVSNDSFITRLDSTINSNITSTISIGELVEPYTLFSIQSKIDYNNVSITNINSSILFLEDVCIGNINEVNVYDSLYESVGNKIDYDNSLILSTQSSLETRLSVDNINFLSINDSLNTKINNYESSGIISNLESVNNLNSSIETIISKNTNVSLFANSVVDSFTSKNESIYDRYDTEINSINTRIEDTEISLIINDISLNNLLDSKISVINEESTSIIGLMSSIINNSFDGWSDKSNSLNSIYSTSTDYVSQLSNLNTSDINTLYDMHSDTTSTISSINTKLYQYENSMNTHVLKAYYETVVDDYSSFYSSLATETHNSIASISLTLNTIIDGESVSSLNSLNDILSYFKANPTSATIVALENRINSLGTSYSILEEELSVLTSEPM